MASDPPYRIVGIAGSLRRGSFNRALLRTAYELAPEGLKFEIQEIGDVPLRVCGLAIYNVIFMGGTALGGILWGTIATTMGVQRSSSSRQAGWRPACCSPRCSPCGASSKPT